MQVWALLWHIRDLSDQPAVVSGIGLARFLPILIFSLLSGVVADRFNRRKIMFITQSTMAVVALILGWLTIGGQITIWSIFGLTAVQAVAQSFDMPARQSLVPNLVPPEDLPSAFSMQSMAFDLGAIIGPALSGLVIGYMGQSAVYFINALSFIAVLAALLLMGSVEQKTAPVLSQDASIFSLKAVKEGVEFTIRQPLILSSMILDFFATFFSSANTLLPFVARDVLHVGAIEYGWLSAAQSIGAVSAALVISQNQNMKRQGVKLLVSVGIFGVATTIFGLVHQFWLVMIALVGIGASDAVSTIIRNTIRQLHTPDSLRGRMISINQIFFTGGPQLGEVESGLVAQAFGPGAAIVTGGIGCIVAAGCIAAKWPQLLKYRGDEPIAAGEYDKASQTAS
jgi:MFS family permease